MKFFFTFFAETETLWSQGPVTRNRHPRAIHPVCSACDEMGSSYAQCAIKFVPRMLSMDCTCKKVHILPLAEHARKIVLKTVTGLFSRWKIVPRL
jgi:hypothetical protein